MSNRASRAKRCVEECVYYWQGTRKSGRWIEACAADPIATQWQLHDAGYVAIVGNTGVGAPKGPPSEEQFVLAGL